MGSDWFSVHWLVFLLALLVGAILGAMIRGSRCRKRLLQMEAQWSHRYKRLEESSVQQGVEFDELVKKNRETEKAGRVVARNFRKKEQELLSQSGRMEAREAEIREQETEIENLASNLAKAEEDMGELEDRLRESEAEVESRSLEILRLESEISSLMGDRQDR